MLEMSIRCFCAVAETGSFSRAARTLFVTQPTVSRYVQALEKQWGFALFVRTSRRVALTRQGEYLHGLLREMQARWDDGLKTAAMMARDTQYQLRLGLPTGWQIERTPILEQFRQRYPHIQLTIQKFTFFALAERLAAGELDLIIQGMPYGYPFETRAGCTSCQALTVPGLVRVSSTHPMAQHAKTVQDLGAMDMFAFSDDEQPNSTTYLTNLITSRGWNMNIVYYPNMESVLAAVDTHMGCSHSVPMSVPLAGSPKHRFYDAGTEICVMLTWETDNHNEALALFIDEVLRAQPEELVLLDNIF